MNRTTVRGLWQLLDRYHSAVYWDPEPSEEYGALGLGAAMGERSIFARAVRRLERHRLVQPDGSRMIVRTELQPVSPRDLARLPMFVRNTHHRLLATRS
jgi:hypothetical protein